MGGKKYLKITFMRERGKNDVPNIFIIVYLDIWKPEMFDILLFNVFVVEMTRQRSGKT